MAKQYKLPPSASAISESLRDLGYSLETAIADLIDNSITAKATEIQVICNQSTETPYLTITDNGIGMTEDDLLSAMKHGSVNPKIPRDSDDLGRFGLGLKTASFSQCRKLTVISSKDGFLSGAEWDLDTISKEDDWLLSILNKSDIKKVPSIEDLPQTGTTVVWRKLDRLVENQVGKKRDEIVNEKIDLTDKHLALVFHRYLSGEFDKAKKISISINGHQVEAFDPFCRKSKATQQLPKEVV